MSDPRPPGARKSTRDWKESAGARYGLALAAPAAATLLMFALYDLTGLERGSVPFVFYFVAVTVAALYGGRGPGLLCILLSALAAHYFFIPPFDAFGLTFSAVLQTSVFVLVSLFISALADRSARAETAARRTRESLETTFRSIGDAVISTDGAGRVNFMNPVAERLTGWPLAEAMGRPLAEVFRIVHEVTREAVESPAEKVLREGRVGGLADHTVLVARDGREVPIDDSGAPIRDGRGRTAGGVLVFHDVTERREAEGGRTELARLVEHERERLKNLVANVPGVVWEAWGEPDESSQRINFVSDHVEQMLGYTVGEWLRTPNFWLTVTHPEDRERAGSEARAIYESGGG
ncbi:MAG: DUF4118 domain-containing protein, partial [Pyrinomonadaceae bacterium]